MSGAERYKVLVVDDSPFMRRFVSTILSSDPRLEVVGTAFNGQMALTKIKELDPDVITLDVEMPIMNGLETLKALKTVKPLPVIMFSSLTKKGAEVTITALELGAFDFLQKPENEAGFDIEPIKHELISKVVAAVESFKRVPHKHTAPDKPVITKIRPPLGLIKKVTKDKLLVIGASTGGPQALKEVMTHLPADIPAKVLIVQHMPPKFTTTFSERLNSICKFPVYEAKDGDMLERGKAFLAPGGYHMTINEIGKICLNQNPPICGLRPAVDFTYQSAADVFKENLVCVILTGMGHDGRDGITYARKKGAFSIAEHESTCVVYGMPRSVIEAGQADAIAPLNSVPEEIMRALYE